MTLGTESIVAKLSSRRSSIKDFLSVSTVRLLTANSAEPELELLQVKLKRAPDEVSNLQGSKNSITIQYF